MDKDETFELVLNTARAKNEALERSAMELCVELREKEKRIKELKNRSVYLFLNLVIDYGYRGGNISTNIKFFNTEKETNDYYKSRLISACLGFIEADKITEKRLLYQNYTIEKLTKILDSYDTDLGYEFYVMKCEPETL